MAPRKTLKTNTNKKNSCRTSTVLTKQQKKGQSVSPLLGVEDTQELKVASDPHLDGKSKEKKSKVKKINKNSKQKSEKLLKNTKREAIIPIRLINEVAHMALTKKKPNPIAPQKKVATKKSIEMNQCTLSPSSSTTDIAELGALIEANILSAVKKTNTKKSQVKNQTKKALKGVVKSNKENLKQKTPKKEETKQVVRRSERRIQTRRTIVKSESEEELDNKSDTKLSKDSSNTKNQVNSSNIVPKMTSPTSERSETRLWTKVLCSNCKSLSPAESTDTVKINGKIPFVYISKNDVPKQNIIEKADDDVEEQKMSILYQDLTISSSSSSSSGCSSSSSSSSSSTCSDSDTELPITNHSDKQSSPSTASCDSGRESSKIKDKQLDPIHLEWLDSICDKDTNMDMFIQSIANNLQEEVAILELCRSARLAAENFLDSEYSNVIPDSIDANLDVNNDTINEEFRAPSPILISKSYSTSNNNTKPVENKPESDDDDCLSLFDNSLECCSLLEEITQLSEHSDANEIPKNIMKRPLYEKQKAPDNAYIEDTNAIATQGTSNTLPYHHLPTLDSDCISLIKGKLYGGYCIFNMIGQCRRLQHCRFYHINPTRAIMLKRLSILSDLEFVQEYVLSRSIFALRRLYMFVFIQECIRRSMWELLMEMAIDNYRFALEDRQALLESILLGFAHTRISEISLLDYKLTNNYLVCDLFIHVISCSNNFSQFKGLFTELTEFYMKIKRKYNLHDAVVMLEKLSATPCHKPLAEAMLNVIFNTDVSILKNSHIERFANSIRGFPVLYQCLRQYRDEKSRSALQVNNEYTHSMIPDTSNLDYFNREKYCNQETNSIFGNVQRPRENQHNFQICTRKYMERKRGIFY